MSNGSTQPDNKNKVIPYARQYLDQDDILDVSKVLASSMITTGPYTKEFEESLCRYTGAKHAVVCANGTAALHLACMALDVSQGDLGITSPNTFLSSANCIEFCGGSTDFIDIDLDTLCLSPEILREYCEKQQVPKVVIPVDFAGLPADLPQIKELSSKYGFSIIEDAAHSIGSSYVYKGQEYKCGSCSHSDLAIFSFHPVKNITCGEGGAVLTNSDEKAERLRKLCSHGMVRTYDVSGAGDGPWYYEMEELGYNYRITDFQCALGNSQLKKLERFKKRKIEIFSTYNSVFKNHDKLIIPDFLSEKLCPHLYPLQFAEGSDKRFEVYRELKKDNIFCQVHYIPVYWQPYYRNKYDYQKGKCPNAELYYSRCLSLPLFSSMTDGEVSFVIDKILKLI